MLSRAIFSALLALIAAKAYASDERGTYIIHMDRMITIELEHSTSGINPKKWYETVLDSIKKTAVQAKEEDQAPSPPQLLYAYETTMTGFAATLSTSQFQAINNMEGVLLAVPDEMQSLHTTYSSHFLGLEPGRGLWNSTNLASDIIIGILDTGIWPEHISFHDSEYSPVPSRWKGKCVKGTNFSSLNCNRKLIGARAFFKGYEAISGRIDETTDFRSPRDSNGHGTHTASTAAGNVVPKASLFGFAEGIASGMRYTSRIAAYKVCWAAGCATSDILAAIDQAVADGIDVLSLSLGGVPRPYYRDSMAIATFGAVQQGVFVSCSAGNSGPNSSSVGNMAPWMMTVGASYLDRSFPTKVKLGNGKKFKGASLYRGKKTKQLPLVYKETAGRRGAEFCISRALSSKLVKGKIVACERGINSRTEKGQLVKAAGGAGMLLLNNANQGEELFADPHILPATTIGAKAAKAIKSYLMLNNNLTASIAFKGTAYGDQAPVMAAFSSRGPSLFDPNVIKPDITTPGVNILAAWPPITSPTQLKSDKRRVQFNIVSGTSMSCPHLSGIAALIKSAHKNWSPAAIKSALMTTAYTYNNRGQPISDAFEPHGSNFATPFAFGSGHVDPERASDPGLVYDITAQDYLNYLCSINYTAPQLSLLSRGNFTCPKGVDLQPGDLNYPSFVVIFPAKRKRVTLTYQRTVTNVGSARSTYTVHSHEPQDVSVIVAPQVLKFNAVGEKQTYKLSFTQSSGGKVASGSWSFGSLTWSAGEYSVSSPIAVTWR
ncbi:hypothetical protein Nepgr_002400 [Nepenthes gracilis]|uniref:Subtilisin-like protease SBT1.1 n=1 Tax=Nepenthes gracilis TaxID=150966 RepID=A0AAD3RY90_NEPGR|nr:hypothetical protein Nepgr_002400 [Nepenthes gracilis]